MPHFMDDDLPSTFGLINQTTNTPTLATANGTTTTPLMTFTVPQNPNGAAENEFNFTFRICAYFQTGTLGVGPGAYNAKYSVTYNAPDMVTGYGAVQKSLDITPYVSVKTAGISRGDVTFTARPSTSSSPSIITINRVVNVQSPAATTAATIKEDIALEGI